jgi:MFS family permease
LTGTAPPAGVRPRSRRDYRLLLFGYFVSTVGDWLYRLALPLLVLDITHSAFSTALVYTLEYAPYVLFSMVGGVLSDRIERRRLLVVGDSTSAVIVGVLALLVWRGLAGVSTVYVVAFLLAGVAPFYHPAFQSILPSLVPPEELATANANLQTIENVTSLAGPLAGGVVIVVLGSTMALALDAVSFALSAVAVFGIAARSQPRTAGTAGRLRAELAEAMAHLRTNRVVLAGAMLFTGTNFAIYLIQANFVFFLVDELHFSASTVGVAFAAQGAGAILGARLAPALGRRYPPGRLIIGCTIGAGLITFLLLVVRSIGAISAVWGAAIALGTVNAVTFFTLRHRTVPDALLGRVVALTRMVAFTSIPIASAVGGAALQALGSIYPLIAIGAGIRMAVGLVGLRTPLNDRRIEPATAGAGIRPGSVGAEAEPVGDLPAEPPVEA